MKWTNATIKQIGKKVFKPSACVQPDVHVLTALACDKVPFYCCAWSNLKSARNAIKSGFRPTWVEMTVKPASIVDKMNI